MRAHAMIPTLTVLYVVAGFVTAITGLATWHRQSARGLRPLAFMLLAAAWWTISDAVELHAGTVADRLLISQIQYLGIACAVPWFFHTAHALARREEWGTVRLRLLVWTIPAIAVVLAWTNPWHHWIWREIEVDAATGLGVYHYGWYVWVLTVQHYVVIVFATTMLVQVAWDAAPHVRTPMLALVGAIALPWVGNVVYMLKLGPWPGLNWASLSFCVSGTVIAVIVTRLGLFDLVPTARAIVLDSLSDGVVVLDRDHRMRYANRSARAMLKLEGQTGRVPEELLPSLLAREQRGSDHTEVAFGSAWLEIRTSPVEDRWGDRAGFVLAIRDASVKRLLEQERERLIVELADAVRQVKALSSLLPICAHCHKVRDDSGYWSSLDAYFREHAGVELTHGVCPDCLERITRDPDELPRR